MATYGVMPVAAQSISRTFAEAAVILPAGDTVRGPLTVMPEKGVVILTMPDLTQRTFSPVMVQGFVVKGELDNTKRSDAGFTAGYLDPTHSTFAQYRQTNRVQMYTARRWSAEQARKHKEADSFFEVLTTGPLQLLQREYSPFASVPHDRPRKEHRYLFSELYVAVPNQELRLLKHLKKELLGLLPSQKKEI